MGSFPETCNDSYTCLGLLVCTRPCTNFLKMKSKDVFCIISLNVSLHAVIATCFKYLLVEIDHNVIKRIRSDPRLNV